MERSFRIVCPRQSVRRPEFSSALGSHGDHRLHLTVSSVAAAAAAVAAVVVAVRRLLVLAPSLGVGQLVVFLPAHAPVLEPHLYLPLAQAQRVRHLDTAASSQVAAKVELLLQLQHLLTSVGRAQALRLWAHVVGVDCKIYMNKQ